MSKSLKNITASLIPYVWIIIGIYIFKNVWIAAVGYHLSAAVFVYAKRYNIRPRSHPVKRSALLIVMNLFVGLLTGVVLYLLWPLLGISDDINDRLNALGITSWVVFGIYYCVVNPIVEELFWRGTLESDLTFPALNDIMFGGYHMLVLVLFMDWQWIAISFVLLVFASWIWGAVSKYKHGLSYIIISHLFADIGIIAALLLRSN